MKSKINKNTLHFPVLIALVMFGGYSILNNSFTSTGTLLYSTIPWLVIIFFASFMIYKILKKLSIGRISSILLLVFDFALAVLATWVLIGLVADLNGYACTGFFGATSSCAGNAFLYLFVATNWLIPIAAVSAVSIASETAFFNKRK